MANQSQTSVVIAVLRQTDPKRVRYQSLQVLVNMQSKVDGEASQTLKSV